MTRAEIVVDLAAIRRNVATLKATAGVAMMTVVKADGYGHGMLESARAGRGGKVKARAFPIVWGS